VVLAVPLGGGRVVEVAAHGSDLTTLAGPFVTAAIPELPRAPHEWPRRQR
jgi:hypothetical protein